MRDGCVFYLHFYGIILRGGSICGGFSCNFLGEGGGGGAHTLFAECNSKNFGLSYYLVYLAKSSLSFFFCVYVYMMFLELPSTFTLLLEKAFCFTLCWKFGFNNISF